jgi:hypothetical protein
MASGWHLERYEKAATSASWSADFSDFAQALEIATAVFGSGKEESILRPMARRQRSSGQASTVC